MWACGSDFQYQNADHWYHNLDKIIHYVNYHASKGGPVVAFYSTPSHYTDAKFAATKAASAKWEVRHDDIFPLGAAARPPPPPPFQTHRVTREREAESAREAESNAHTHSSAGL